ncbi:Conserved_hypothetical protein [Hexamita inflata]|uniref:Uncharacterized protein n=1 Tax=Hexamita inflata TaxID=28002 RepID=A0AA86V6H1_9EUKA|nr:Conserved hypothetical protein [Hexamita inflata]
MTVVSFIAPDNVFQQISSYLYTMSRSREQLQLLLPQSLMVPDKIIVYPRNRVQLCYQMNLEQLDNQRLSNIVSQMQSQNRLLTIPDTIHIIKELLLICIILHRNSFSTCGIGMDQVFVNQSTGQIRINIIGDTDRFIQHFFRLADSDFSGRLYSESTLINSLYTHFNLQNSLEIEIFQEFCVDLMKYTQIKENAILQKLFQEFVQSDNYSFAQLFCKLLYFERVYKDLQVSQASLVLKQKINSLLNPFTMLNHYLGLCYQRFMKSDKVTELTMQMLQDNEQFKTNFHTKIQNFINKNVFQREQDLFQDQTEQMNLHLKYSRVTAKIITIKQKKQQIKLFSEGMAQLAKFEFSQQLVVLHIKDAEQYVHDLIQYTKDFPQNTILDKSTNVMDLLIEYMGNTHSSTQQNAPKRNTFDDISSSSPPKNTNNNSFSFQKQIEDISKASYETYAGNSVVPRYRTYMREMYSCTQYLGQVFPELLQLLDIEPNLELSTFDCLTGGLYLIMLTRYLIKPFMKIVFVLEQDDFISASEIDRNIIQAMLVCFNDELAYNSQIYFLEQTEPVQNVKKAQRAAQIHSFINKSQAQKLEHQITQEFIDGDGSKIISFVSGKSSTAPELLYIYEQIQNSQCEKLSWFCLFNQLKKYFIQSGLYYLDTNDDNFQSKLLQTMKSAPENTHQKLRENLYESIKQTQMTVQFSVDYWTNTVPCPHKANIFVELLSNIKQSNTANKNLRIVLFAASLLTKQVTVQFLADLCKIEKDEIISICEQLSKQRIMTKIQHDKYMITELEQTRQIIMALKCNDINYVADYVFTYLIQEYDLLNDIQKHMKTPEAQADLYSQIWRMFSCFDICDRIEGQIPVLQLNKNLDKYVTKKTNFVLFDKDYSNIHSIDQVLSHSHDLLTQSDSDSEVNEELEDLMFGFQIQGHNKESLVQVVQKDKMKTELLKVSGILIRIKIALVLISCLSPNTVSEGKCRPKATVQSIQQKQSQIIVTNNTPFIQYIIKRTNQLVETMKLLIKKTPQLSTFENTLTQLETSCQWYQFVNMPLNAATTALAELCTSNVAPAGLSLIAWRLLRTGYAKESINFCLFQLSPLLNYERIYRIERSLAKHQLGIVQENTIFDIQQITMKYYEIFVHKTPFKQSEFPFTELVLLLEALISGCRVTGNIHLQIAVCSEILKISSSFGYFQFANICLLILLNFLTQNCSDRQASAEYKLIERALTNVKNETIEVIIAEPTVILRTRAMFQQQSSLRNQYMDLMIDFNADHDYQTLCDRILQHYSFSSLLELILIDNSNMQLNDILLKNIDDYTNFDSPIGLKIMLCNTYFVHYLKQDTLSEHYADIRQSLDYWIRVSESQHEAGIYSLINAFVDSIYFRATITSSMKQSQVFWDKTDFVIEDIYLERLEQGLFYVIIVLQGFNWLQAKLSDQEVNRIFCENMIKHYVGVVKWTVVEDNFKQWTSTQQDICSDHLLNTFYLFQLKKQNVDLQEIMFKAQNILERLQSNKNSIYLLFGKQKKTDNQIIIRNVIQRKVKQEENGYGFIYFWVD